MSRETTYYGLKGEIVDDVKKAFAKETLNDETNIRIYYVLCNKKQMVNPYIVTHARNAEWKFLKTVEAKFNYYIRFLKTRSEKYYTLAKREI